MNGGGGGGEGYTSVSYSVQVCNRSSLSGTNWSNAKILYQSGAWHAEAVDWAVIKKLGKIKTLQGFKKFSGWRSRGNFPWVTQGMSCKRSFKANL